MEHLPDRASKETLNANMQVEVQLCSAVVLHKTNQEYDHLSHEDLLIEELWHAMSRVCLLYHSRKEGDGNNICHKQAKAKM